MICGVSLFLTCGESIYALWRRKKKTYCGDMSFSVVNRLNRLYSNKKLHKVQTSFESTSFLLYESFS